MISGVLPRPEASRCGTRAKDPLDILSDLGKQIVSGVIQRAIERLVQEDLEDDVHDGPLALTPQAATLLSENDFIEEASRIMGQEEAVPKMGEPGWAYAWGRAAARKTKELADRGAEQAAAQDHLNGLKETHEKIYPRVESVPGGFAPSVVKLVRERGAAYGHPSDNHGLTATLWSRWLSRRLRREITLSAEDVIMLNVLQKCSRLAEETKDDSWYDVAGYTENVAMLRPDQRNQTAA